jgi:hypothetical protein
MTGIMDRDRGSYGYLRSGVLGYFQVPREISSWVTCGRSSKLLSAISALVYMVTSRRI